MLVQVANEDRHHLIKRRRFAPEGHWTGALLRS